ncbi:hypothetical protein AOC36_08930 [Erysipelothrix larvae]|uniref:Uncharacterized protein n=1 Tax=Erysipelothrix larvae TaxID=1514105 RepID=A0A0X8H104_9FIRM|nr:hypothetical protein [Erysipelothrix larvae]AMC94107.1 hypothetical protein AOC36_08930 [Erysipelothrix larvae]
MIKKRSINQGIIQGVADYFDFINVMRLDTLENNLKRIFASQEINLESISKRSKQAIDCLSGAEKTIDSLIISRRGADKGVHGFIAEFTEEAIRNSRSIYQKISEHCHVLNDNGITDLNLNGENVQMKFNNNIRQGLEHAKNYRSMKLMIPKDKFEICDKIMNGERYLSYDGELSLRKTSAIKQIIQDESKARGQHYTEWLIPSVSKYDDVQKGNIFETLGKEKESIIKQTSIDKAHVEETMLKQKEIAIQNATPSMSEALKSSGVVVLLHGGINFGLFVLAQHQNGKEIWQFDREDWKNGGIQTIKGSVKGGISGLSIYALTNFTKMPSPIAASINSCAFGISNAIIRYRNSEIDEHEFVSLLMLSTLDSTGSAIGATIGKTLIPIPILGALVGSVVMTTALNVGQDMFSTYERDYIIKRQEEINDYVHSLNQEYQAMYEKLIESTRKLGTIQEYAFDFDANIQLQFESSIDLARLSGVLESNIIHDETEVDDYFLI